MTVWFLTIGTSDVQIKSQNSWTRLFREYRSRLNTTVQFEPRQLDKDSRKPSLVHPRVMGVVYENENLDELVFPLLDNFRQEISRQNIVFGVGDRIVVILTDQSNIFPPRKFTADKSCPYWQDTCTLKSILEKYFQQYFPETALDYLILEPHEAGAGLDSWDEVLGLVQEQFELQASSVDEVVYVSHQAGTPAISSAVQFCSLAKFGHQVQFLVSNEFDANLTRVIDSSSYLFHIQRQAALTLIERYDYAGARELLKSYLYKHKTDQSKSIQDTFKALVQWNLAEFEDFAKLLKKIPDLQEQVEARCQNWWWLGYESAYLGIVRYRQNNTVEALFHTCRSTESLVCDWAQWRFADHCQADLETGAPQIKISIFTELPGYEQKIPYASQKYFHDNQFAGLYGKTLYALFTVDRPTDAGHPIFRHFLKYTVQERNQYFHQSLGLKDKQLFQAWLGNRINLKTAEKDWETRVLSCLNLITGESYSTFEEASLMATVHNLLVQQVEQYNLFNH